MTNALGHEPGETITLVITCVGRQLRVDGHDTSCFASVPMDAPADAEAGRGLMLVATLSADWGYYWTRADKAVHFTLAFQGRDDEGAEGSPRGDSTWAR